MLYTTAISIFFIVWTLVYLIDHYLRYYKIRFYMKLIDRIGLNVELFVIRFYTTRLNKSFALFGYYGTANPTLYGLIRRILTIWFIIGAVSALLALFLTTTFLSYIFWREIYGIFAKFLLHSRQTTLTYFGNSYAIATRENDSIQPYSEAPQIASESNSIGLVPLVPGVNIPWDRVPLFAIVLVISGFIHEMGHAVAAASFNVTVRGFGLLIVGIYPGAFTELDSLMLGRAPLSQKIRIYSAGIWHNFVLALFAYLIFLCHPLLLSALFYQNVGVTVESIDERSALYGISGLQTGDIITGLNDYATKNLKDWCESLQKLKTSAKRGYCMRNDVLSSNIATEIILVRNELKCCHQFENTSESHLCFYYRNETTLHSESDYPKVTLKSNIFTVMELFNTSITPKKVGGDEIEKKLYTSDLPKVEQSHIHFVHACLYGRHVAGQKMCASSSDCGSNKNGGKLIEEQNCIFPALFNDMKLIKIAINRSKLSVLFIGSVDELFHYVKLIGYVPRFSFLPTTLPNVIRDFLALAFVISLGMAFLNAVPCYGLDGQQICATLIDSLFPSVRLRKRRKVLKILLYYGTVVLFGNIVIAFTRLFHIKPQFDDLILSSFYQ